jgi:acyl-coenzyme A thioesterase PaaI-like protein
MPTALSLFERLGGSAPGRWLFSRIVCWRAPYFATIVPRIEVLAPGRCVVRLRDRRRVHNHLGTVHAIALCNAAELAAGLATDAALDASLRWIPKAMQVNYLKPARGTLTATANVPPADPGESGCACPVGVEVRDAGGETVFSAVVSMWITRRRKAA